VNTTSDTTSFTRHPQSWLAGSTRRRSIQNRMKV